MEFKGTKGKWRVFTNVHRECDGSEWGWVGLDTFNSKSINKCSIHWSGDEAKANALLISKAPEMLEKLSEIVNILDIKCTDGCVNKTWGDFQNGNGEDVGLEIDKFIKDTKQLIKEATEL